MSRITAARLWLVAAAVGIMLIPSSASAQQNRAFTPWMAQNIAANQQSWQQRINQAAQNRNNAILLDQQMWLQHNPAAVRAITFAQQEAARQEALKQQQAFLQFLTQPAPATGFYLNPSLYVNPDPAASPGINPNLGRTPSQRSLFGN